MNKNRIRLTESQLHNIIKESVNKVLSEADWKTFLNAARGRKKQADELREHPFFHGRNSYDDAADKLEKHAKDTFQKKYGKNGHSHQYEGDSSDYKGRYDHRDSDIDFVNKHDNGEGYWDGEKAQRTANYRYGNGFPYMKHGEIHDDTFDYAEGEGYTGDRKRKHTTVFTKDGEQYSPENSTVGDEVSISKDKDYNKALDNMAKDMEAYYTGKAKYQKGKGWQNKDGLDESIRRAIRKVLR